MPNIDIANSSINVVYVDGLDIDIYPDVSAHENVYSNSLSYIFSYANGWYERKTTTNLQYHILFISELLENCNILYKLIYLKLLLLLDASSCT